MSRIETVSAEDLECLLSSSAFNNNLTGAIEISLRTGRETGFAVLKEMFEKNIIYTKSIYIGDKSELSREIGFERAKVQYKKETGRNPQLFAPEARRDFEQFCSGRREYCVPVPQSGGKTWGDAVKNREISGYYPLVHVHTHTCDDLRPSRGDLRKCNYLTGFFQGPEQVCPKPIGMIVGAVMSPVLGVIFYQEKKPEPINTNDLGKARAELTGCLEALRTLRQKGDLPRPALKCNQDNRYYNIALAIFDRMQRRIDFGRKAIAYTMDFRDFAFSCSEQSHP
jgi:hypothetical protein